MNHRNYLIDLANELAFENFEDVWISDGELRPLSYRKDGAKALADETLQVDDPTMWVVTTPGERPDHTFLKILTCNEPWETVYDFETANPEASKKVTSILSHLEQKYTPPGR